ncbi:hypothetical protein ACJMK2_044434 [Sinanodonta woodiana]|uniref:LEM domain-containing protein n=1 Tax=Sinanodonta woodiana TaxID=1069815 RepID=A0ABD3W2Y4_SINWO
MATSISLFEALDTKNFELTYECLENGADPNLIIPEKGVSPMHIAAGLGVHATALLLQYGGDPNVSIDSATPSTDSSLDQLNKSVDIPNDTQDLEKYLDTAKKKKSRLSLYTQEVQKRCDDFFGKGCNTYVMDVTSPDHPYFDIKSNTGIGSQPQDNDIFQGNDMSDEESLHLHVSVSDEEEDLVKTLLSISPFMENEKPDAAEISSDSYVTCNSHLDSDLDELNNCQTLDDLEAEWGAESGNKHNTFEKNENEYQSTICRQTENKSDYSKHCLMLNSKETPSKALILNKAENAEDKCSTLITYPATSSQKASDSRLNSSGYSSSTPCRQKFEMSQARGKPKCPEGNNTSNTNQKYFEDIRCDLKNCASYNNSHCFSTPNTCSHYRSLCAQNNRTIAFKNSSSAECASHNIHSDSPYYYHHCALCSLHTCHLNKMGCPTQHQNITQTRKHNYTCFKENFHQISDKNDDEFYMNDYHNTCNSCEHVKPHDQKWRQSKNEDQIMRQSANKDHTHRQSTNYQNAIQSWAPDVNLLGMKFQAANLYEQVPPQEDPNLDNSLISDDESFFDRHNTETVMKKKKDDHKMRNCEETDIKELNILKPQQAMKVNVKSCPFPDIETKNLKKRDKATISIDSKNLIKENNNIDVNNVDEMLPTKQETISSLEEEERFTSLDIFNKGFVSNRTSISSAYSDALITEYVYRDPEMGITLIERRISSQFGSSGRPSIDSLCSISSIHSSDSDRTILYDWRAYDNLQIDASKVDDGIQVPDHLKRLSDDEVRAKLRLFREDPGPVTASTRQTYLVKLTQLEKDPEAAKLKLTKKSPGYPPELVSALEGKLDQSDMVAQEIKMIEAFQNPNKRRWREGTIKSSFNYILLDPRVTRNLPNRAANLAEQEAFRIFISAIFYIGKGKRARPYSHLYEAINQMKKPHDQVSPKVYHILDIWNDNVGVVSLHCFQSVIPVEAYTREACMVDAIGLENLTNKKRGDYYGVATTWSMKQKRKMGVYILKKALQIFLAEGERQICPPDIKTGF